MPSETKERLITAAWDCIREGGRDRATSRAIAGAADANLGAITYHFGSKDALVGEAVGSAIEALVTPALVALADESLDPASRLLNALGQLQRSYDASTDDAPAYLEVLIQSRRQPELHMRVGRVFAEVRTTLSTLMADLKANGFLPDWVQPDAMAGLLLAVAQGVVLQTSIDDAGPSQPTMTDQFAHLLLASRVEPS